MPLASQPDDCDQPDQPVLADIPLDPDDARLIAMIREVITRHLNASVGEVLQVVGEANLSLPQLVTLHALRCQGSLSISGIAQHLSLSLAATSHMVDRLVRQKLVERRENTEDRRHKQVVITQAGSDLVDWLVHVRTRDITHSLLRLPPALRQRLLDVLDDVTSYILDEDVSPSPTQEQ